MNFVTRITLRGGLVKVRGWDCHCQCHVTCQTKTCIAVRVDAAMMGQPKNA